MILDRAVAAHWRLTPGPLLGDRDTTAWAATRGGAPLVVKHFPAHVPDWAYTLRVAAALRSRGWPTPEPVEEPLVRPAGAWVVFRRLPGRPAGGDASTGQRARGRLLAELHPARRAGRSVVRRRVAAGPAGVLSMDVPPAQGAARPARRGAGPALAGRPPA